MRFQSSFAAAFSVVGGSFLKLCLSLVAQQSLFPSRLPAGLAPFSGFAGWAVWVRAKGVNWVELLACFLLLGL